MKIALHFESFAERSQPLAQHGETIANAAPVDFELRFAGTARPDSAPGAREMIPQMRQARQQVLELRDLHLHLRGGRACSTRKDIENDFRAIDDLQLGDLLEIARLGRRKVVIEHEKIRVFATRQIAELLCFSGADVGAAVHPGPRLQHAVQHARTAGFGERGELVEAFLALLAAIARQAQANANGPLFTDDLTRIAQLRALRLFFAPLRAAFAAMIRVLCGAATPLRTLRSLRRCFLR
jgi:hypothetical protein